MAQARLRLRLTSAAESIVRSGHPWVFSNSIREQNREGEAGELAVVYDRNDRFLAIGLYDPDSALRLRVLHAGKPVTIDGTWWQERLRATFARRSVLDEQTTACRWINGESDGWPGLVLDQYEDVLVLKLYTAAWAPQMDLLVSMLRGNLNAKAMVLRLSRNVQAYFANRGWRDGQMLFGAPIKSAVIFRETGIYFEADVIAGQKTGFFLDQRENRRIVETLSGNARVLNAFSFSGGFSLYAARGGAQSVTDLDISAHALGSAKRNFGLNLKNAPVAHCRHETIQANAFDWLAANSDRQFDLIVLDPPSLAKREAERAGAIRAYEKLVLSAVSHLHPCGTLVAASCSAHVSADEFFGAVRQALTVGRRAFDVLRTTRHASDHPATFPEAEYLKCIYIRLQM